MKLRAPLGALLFALAVAGCASKTPQDRAGVEPVRADDQAYRYCEPRARMAQRSLLAPLPAPDCEFKQSGRDSVDPEVFARLKLDYERQCYRKAETSVRRRLQLLQSISRKCGIWPERFS